MGDDVASFDTASADRRGDAGPLVGFRGPYADGPPPASLEIHAPDLDRFGIREILRMLTVSAVLAVSILKGLVTKVLHPGRGSLLFCVSERVIDGFFVLGPTFVKTGQILASSPGLFPDDVSRPAQKCLQEVPPFSSDIVRQVIEEDLGRPPERLFRSFDDIPLSAASVGQVHACVLPDGREAVVKVQRPDIAMPMNTDLRIVYVLAKLAQRTDIGRRANAIGQVRDLHRVTNQELNTTLEAYRQDQFRSNLHAFGDNLHVTAPEVYWDYCGPRVICMERLRGVPMDDFEALEELGVDARANLRRGMKAWLEALTIHGPFHGDLHAGNIWALEDGRNAFLDFGIMGHLEPEWRELVKDILYTFIIDQDFVRIVRGYKRLGVIAPALGDDRDLADLMAAAFAPILASRMEDLQFAALFQQALEMAERFGDISAPEELTLIGKQFLYFERYVKGIAPDYLLVDDPYLLKNIFPEAAAARMAELRAADPAAQIDPDESPDPAAAPEWTPGAGRPVGAPVHADGGAVDAGVVLPDVAYRGRRFAFLSGAWFEAVDALSDLAPTVPGEVAAAVVDLVVTGAPDGDTAVHLRNGRVGRGHTGAPTTVTMPYDVALASVVSLDPAPAMTAMLEGRITVEGDASALLGMWSQVTPTPEQLRFAAEVRARTLV